MDGESFSTVPQLIHRYQTSQQNITKRSEIVLRRPVLKVPAAVPENQEANTGPLILFSSFRTSGSWTTMTSLWATSSGE